jgi:uncharacterized protein (TIGR03083 family)
MDSPQKRVKVAIAESTRLKAYLHSLPPEAWNQSSACDRWEVRDVVAHLAWMAETYTERIHHSLQEDTSISEGQPPLGPVSAAAWAAGNAQRALSRREQLEGQVLSDFMTHNDQLNQLMSTLGPEDWDRPHYYASLGIEPLRFRPDLWIQELVMHGWDIRSRLEPEAHLSNESLPVLMDVIPGQLERFIFSPAPRLPTPMRYRWELTGAGAKHTDVVVEGDKARVEPAATGKADVIFHCDTETFVFIAFGRLSIDAAIGAERLSVHGDKKLARGFQQWFPGL